MGVTFVLGRAGAGKTRWCIDRVLAALDAPDARRLILLVPEQASFQMERLLATRSPRGGYSRAEVLSFSHLALRVWGEQGREPPLLSRAARALALRAVAQRVAPELHVLRRALHTRGFYAHLERLLDELLLEGVMPEQLADAADRLTDARAAAKTREVATLLGAYLDWLGPHRIDPALRLRVLRQRLETVPWLRQADLWVDGFAGFTGQEVETLVTLGRLARHVHISLLLDPQHRAEGGDEGLRLFRRTESTWLQLRALFEAAGVDVKASVELAPPVAPRFGASPPLARLEAVLSGAAAPVGDGAAPAGVRVLACETRRDELRQAARFIRQQVAASGGTLRFRDFAVIARDLEPLADVVAEVFGEYGLPYFLDRRRPMRAHPLNRLIQALFAAAASDGAVLPMTRLLRTELLPVSRAEAEELENVLVRHQVRGLGAWRRDIWSFDDEAFLGGRPRPGPPDVTRAARLRIAAGLDPLVQLARALPADGRRWAACVYDTLMTLAVPRRLQEWIDAARAADDWEAAELHRLAWDALCAVLDDLSAVLGESPLRAGEVAEILGTALDELTLGLAPPTLDQVLVGAIERSRHPDIRHAWLVGFNEGVFPARPPDDRVFSATERSALVAAGLPAPRPHREDAFDERLLAYIACTRPSHSLTISFATVDDEGQPVQPSPLLDEVCAALPGLTVERPVEYAPPVTLQELVRGQMGERRGARPDATVRARYVALRGLAADDERHAGLLAELTAGEAYRNEPEPLGNYRAPRSGPPGVVWDTSPSELETYLACPFQHLLKYGIDVDDQRGPRPLSWDLGTLAHELMADVTRAALRRSEDVTTLGDDAWRALLAEALEQRARLRPADLAERRPDSVFMAGLLGRLVEDVLLAQVDRWRRGAGRPRWCEARLGDGEEALPPLLLDVEGGGRVRVRGRIDRIDECRTDGRTWVVLCDYKSKAESLAKAFLTGTRLQLFVYARALRDHYPAPGETRIGGVLVVPLRADRRMLNTQYGQAASPAEQRMYLYRPRGLLDQAAARLLDRELGDRPSPVAGMKLKKDGTFSKGGDAVPGEQLTARLALAEDTVRAAAAGVCRGAIDVAPLVEKRTLACQLCPFIRICRFERGLNPARAAERALPSLGGADAADAGGEDSA